MFRHRLNLIQIFGIMTLGIALSLLLVAWALNGEAYRSEDRIDRDSLWGRNGFIIISLLLAVPAVGLLIRKKWAVTFLIVLFWVAIFGCIGLFVLAFFNTSRTDVEGIALLAGFFILILAFFLAGILYLNNAWVLESFPGNGGEKEGLADVLDQ
ncbi:MAG: hypothetical protein SH848_00220 [Saprospiraceae bacterium]|nr:hypothetical protein [Saprospiraceae bacterium]MDZ4702320.1 hypothetical protein [Saprospiraceae bacterium]